MPRRAFNGVYFNRTGNRFEACPSGVVGRATLYGGSVNCANGLYYLRNGMHYNGYNTIEASPHHVDSHNGSEINVISSVICIKV